MCTLQKVFENNHVMFQFVSVLKAVISFLTFHVLFIFSIDQVWPASITLGVLFVIHDVRSPKCVFLIVHHVCHHEVFYGNVARRDKHHLYCSEQVQQCLNRSDKVFVFAFYKNSVVVFPDVEWFDIKHRTFAGVIVSLDWTLGSWLLVGIAYGVNEWRMLILAVSSPLILSVIAWK